MGAGYWAAVTFDGETWTQFHLPNGIILQETAYLDSLTLISTSLSFYGPDEYRGQISRSVDGGLSWESLFLEYGPQGGVNPPVISPSGTILVGVHTRSELWRSTDRGDSWQIVNGVFHSSFLVAADTNVFFSMDPGSASRDPYVARSTDDGLTWEVVWTDTLPGVFLNLDIAFSDALHGWISGNSGSMVQTSDGGMTWETYVLPDSGWGVISMSFLDSTLGWGVDPGPGAETLIYRWSTGAGIGEGWRTPTIPNNLQIVSVYPNPFNSQATILLQVLHTCFYKATVFDILGRQVDVLADGLFVSGIHQLNWEGVHYAAGTYFLQVGDGRQIVTTKLDLLK